MATSAMVVENTTITGNSAGVSGGGLATKSCGCSSITTEISNTIIGGNVAPDGPDVSVGESVETLNGNQLQFGELIADYSIVGVVDPDGTQVTGTGLVLGDPLLGPLANNGGPTLTHLPLAGSPAIDAGDPAFVAPPADDQRHGRAR